ncbi:hypothetical protein P5V15_005981 [Pogonomyrmex californicus]
MIGVVSNQAQDPCASLREPARFLPRGLLSAPSPPVVRIRHACRTLPTHQRDHHTREGEPGRHASETRAAEEEKEDEEKKKKKKKRTTTTTKSAAAATATVMAAVEVEDEGSCAAICSPES